MADTRVQVRAEDWVRREWAPTQFGEPFYRERVQLDAGGVFDFDGVNASKSTAMVISTSGCRTSGGKYAVGKIMKIRSDILFLVMAQCSRKVVVSTDAGMHEQLVKEQGAGRLPRGIEFFHAPLPTNLATELAEAQRIAAAEVTPKGRVVAVVRAATKSPVEPA